MNTPAAFYNEQITSHKEQLSALKTKLNVSSVLRLLVFLLIALGVYLFWGETKIIVGVLVIGIALFLFLISRHAKLQYQRDLAKSLIDINKTELKVLERDFYELPDGKSFQPAEHAFSQDIDLFGRGSFFQYANRTALESGGQRLADIFLANDISDISQKQEAIQELAPLATWRQKFSGVASLVKTEVKAPAVVEWLKNYKPFTFNGIKLMSRIFSGISIAVFALYFLGLISGYWIFAVFGLGMAISGRYVKKVSSVSADTSKIQSTFDQYHKLLLAIEEQPFSSTLLSRKRTSIISEKQIASNVLKKFSRHLDALDQRNNVLVAFIANGFFLRDLAIVNDIEKWIDKHHIDVANWFEVITSFDAYNSLGNYAFNHPTHSFPEIKENGSGIQAQKIAHPLLNPEVAVKNNFDINETQFFIITGANMAGKSTFLRTVGLQIVMSNIGLPVCAEKATYGPIKLISSMRTTDSLTDDESYFFSELKRLKFIVDTIDQEQYFIILDEILKGTNSTDKAMGSRKFVDRLVKSGATGIIATHDLSLCESAEELEAVENYFFDAIIENDELYFDYTFKKGICQNMNASFLLKKMKIVE